MGDPRTSVTANDPALLRAMEAADLGVWELDLSTRELRSSERLRAIHRIESGEARASDWMQRIHPEDRERVRTAFQQALQEHGDLALEHRMLGDQGQVRWIATRAVIVRDEGGRPLRAIGVSADVTERRSAEDARARLAAIVQSSDDAIIGQTLEGVITSWNEGAQRIFGYTAEEMIGQPIYRLVPGDRAAEVPRILAAIGRGERLDHYDTQRIHKDGRRIFVSLTVSPIKDPSGRIVGVSKIARDVTDRRRAEEERQILLEQAREAHARAEAANRAKDEFLSRVSHELRTPLASMLGWVAVLRLGKVPAEEAARALESIERSGRLQAKLIEDMLDLSRIATGRLKMEFRPVELRGVAQAALLAFQPDADARGVRLEARLQDGVLVRGDPLRLQQVISNLLSNAIKFTPPQGLVQLSLECAGGEARIAVRDTGSGIAPAALTHVFQPFWQAQDKTQARGAGLGLGLAIVRSLVEGHGGQVRASSEGEGKGATFTVTLPLLAERAATAGKG